MSKPGMYRARWRVSAWPDRRSCLHFWRNRLYVRYGWQHWPTSPDLRKMP